MNLKVPVVLIMMTKIAMMILMMTLTITIITKKVQDQVTGKAKKTLKNLTPKLRTKTMTRVKIGLLGSQKNQWQPIMTSMW